MINHERIPRIFDQRLKLVRPLRTYSDGGVYEVERSGKPYVLKVQREDSSYAKMLNREASILPELKSVDGVTHLVDDLGTVRGYRGVLKEYAHGEILRNVPRERLQYDFWTGLYGKVERFHVNGVAGLDIGPDNVVVSPDMLHGTLLDFGFAVRRTRVPADVFDRKVAEDHADLRKLMD